MVAAVQVILILLLLFPLRTYTSLMEAHMLRGLHRTRAGLNTPRRSRLLTAKRLPRPFGTRKDEKGLACNARNNWVFG